MNVLVGLPLTPDGVDGSGVDEKVAPGLDVGDSKSVEVSDKVTPGLRVEVSPPLGVVETPVEISLAADVPTPSADEVSGVPPATEVEPGVGVVSKVPDVAPLLVEAVGVGTVLGAGDCDSTVPCELEGTPGVGKIVVSVEDNSLLVRPSGIEEVSVGAVKDAEVSPESGEPLGVKPEAEDVGTSTVADD